MEDVPLKTNNDDDDDEQSSQLQENLFEMTKFATAYTYIGICLYQSLFFFGGGDSNLGRQDGRRRRIRCAMVAPLHQSLLHKVFYR